MDKVLTESGSAEAQFRHLKQRKLADSIYEVEQARAEYQLALKDFTFAREALTQGEADLCRWRSDYATWRNDHDLFPEMPELTHGYGQAFDLRDFTSDMQSAEQHLSAARFTQFLNQRRERYWSETDGGRHHALRDFENTLPSAAYPMTSALSSTLVGNWQVTSSDLNIDPNVRLDPLEASTSSLDADGVRELQHYFVLHVDNESRVTAEQFYTIYGHVYALVCVLGRLHIVGDDGTAAFEPSQGFTVDVLSANARSSALYPVTSNRDNAYVKTLPIVKEARDNLAKLMSEAFPGAATRSIWKISMDDQESFEISTGEGLPRYRLTRLYFTDDSSRCSCPVIPIPRTGP